MVSPVVPSVEMPHNGSVPKILYLEELKNPLAQIIEFKIKVAKLEVKLVKNCSLAVSTSPHTGRLS